MAKSVNQFATIMLALLACVATLVGLSIGTAQGAANLPTGFTDSSPPFVSGLTNPTDMEFAPDGRLFITEDAGRVRIAKPDGTLSTFLDISTKVESSPGERGLLALTFDPGFATNHYLYLHYPASQSRRALHRQRRQSRLWQREAHLQAGQPDGRNPVHGRGARLRHRRQALRRHWR